MTNRSHLTPRNVLIGGVALLSLVSWSPPTGEDVTVTSNNVLIRNEVLDLRVTSHTANTYTNYPAVILGTANNVALSGNPGRGVVVGASNIMGTLGAYGAIFGNVNKSVSANSLLVGNGNLLTETATDLATNAASNSALIGKTNKV